MIMEDLHRKNRELREEVNRLHKELEEKGLKNKELQEEVNKQKEEINELKEENQKLRQEIFGLKSSKKRRGSSNTKQKHKKRGPPFGHKGTSRKRPDRVDTTIVLDAPSTCDFPQQILSIMGIKSRSCAIVHNKRTSPALYELERFKRSRTRLRGFSLGDSLSSGPI